jgi:hypothetical protein
MSGQLELVPRGERATGTAARDGVVLHLFLFLANARHGLAIRLHGVFTGVVVDFVLLALRQVDSG